MWGKEDTQQPYTLCNILSSPLCLKGTHCLHFEVLSGSVCIIFLQNNLGQYLVHILCKKSNDPQSHFISTQNIDHGTQHFSSFQSTDCNINLRNYALQCTVSSQICYILFHKKEKLYNKNIIFIHCGSSIWHIICNTKAH